MTDKELTTLEIKKRFFEQFYLGRFAAPNITFRPKEITVAHVRSCLQSKTTNVQDKKRLNATGQDFWKVALQVMDKLKK